MSGVAPRLRIVFGVVAAAAAVAAGACRDTPPDRGGRPDPVQRSGTFPDVTCLRTCRAELASWGYEVSYMITARGSAG